MLNVNFIILALLIAAFVLAILGFFLAPQRIYIWVAAGACAIIALLLKVFAGGV